MLLCARICLRSFDSDRTQRVSYQLLEQGTATIVDVICPDGLSVFTSSYNGFHRHDPHRFGETDIGAYVCPVAAHSQ